MNLKIIKYRAGKKGTIYSLLQPNDKDDSLTGFLQMYFQKYRKEVESIVNRLQFMIDKTGFLDEYFVSESPDSKNLIYKVKYLFPNPKLRLACRKLSTAVLIIGGGAVKKTQKWQQDSELADIFRLLLKIDKHIAVNGIDLNKDEIEIQL